MFFRVNHQQTYLFDVRRSNTAHEGMARILYGGKKERKGGMKRANVRAHFR
jgi:hypothetical protein